jgi:hypothetical protein
MQQLMAVHPTPLHSTPPQTTEKESAQRTEYLRSQCEVWESRYRELEEEYRAYKAKMAKTAVAQLQLEVERRDTQIAALQKEADKREAEHRVTKAALQQ